MPRSAAAAQPTGGFTFSPQVPLAGQSVGFSAGVTDPDGGTITQYAWDFGDGATATGPSVSHTYTSGGAKRVTLTATDSDNESNTFSNTVTVDAAAPVASFTVSPSSRVAQLDSPSFGFTSTSTDETGISSSVWNFGDGTLLSGSSASHAYSGAGTRTVTLTVTDTDGVSSSASESVRVNAAPVATFSFAVPFPNLLPGEPYNVPVLNNPVAFSANGSSDPDGSIVSYAWDLNGDGQFQEQSAPSFLQPLTTPGVVNVGLKVTDNDGASSTAIVPIRVDQVPVASFTFSPSSPVAGQRVDFTSTSSDPDGPQDISSLQWDLNSDGTFGDASGPTATRVFSTAGTYTVGLEAIDSVGLKVFQLQTLSVRIPGSANSISGPGAPFKVALVSSPTTASGKGTSSGSKSRLSVIAGIRVAIAGRVAATTTKITRLIVSAPAGARVAGRCKGAGCHVKPESHRAGKQGRVRLRHFERTFRVGTRIVVEITKSGQIGKQIVFTTRRGQPPKRSELCLAPGSPKASRCPS